MMMEPDVISHTQRVRLESQMSDEDLGAQLKRLRITDNVRELQTVIRDKNTTRSDFIFFADRLIRLVVEEGLNHLPYLSQQVITPTGYTYDGLRYEKGNCGVSVMRSGEVMEQGLRDCCRSMRIGKILIKSDEDTDDSARVVYAKLPPDIHSRKVLLMYPILSTGKIAIKALNVLKEYGVPESNVIFLNLFCTPRAVKMILNAFPSITLLTSEVHPIAPIHFGQKYFGTD